MLVDLGAIGIGLLVGVAVVVGLATLVTELVIYRSRAAEIERDAGWQTMWHERIWEEDNHDDSRD